MIPCPGCSRFIRTETNACPFCDAVVRDPSTLGTVVAGALLGLTLTAACTGENGDDAASDETSTTEMGVAAYGGPDPFDSSGPPDAITSSGPDTTGSEGSTSSGGETSTGTGTDTGTGVDSTSDDSGTSGGTGTGTTSIG